MTFSAYANTGPFTNNVTPPSLSAQYNNNIESFLDQIVAPLVADSHVTADGLGNVTTLSVTLTSTGTGLTVQHNATVSGILTTTGNHVANGGMNVNTIRDNTNGNTAIDLSAGSGLAKFPHGLSLITGSFSRMSIFSAGSVTTTPAFFNHGLGTTPDIVLLQITGTSVGAFSVEYESGSMTSSQVKLTSNSASGVAVVGLALKQ